jgi:hypothetical protein
MSTSLLSLAAAPTFAVMAVIATFPGSPAVLCAHDASALSGMGVMYLLMSVFHAGPWLRLVGKAAVKE